MGCGLSPTRRFARSFHGVSNIFAIAQRRFAEQLTVLAAHFKAVARIWPRLLSADVELYRAVDGEVSPVSVR